MAKKLLFTDQQREEIERAMKGTHAGHVYKRLLVLKLRAVDQYDNEKAGKAAGLHETSVSRIVTRYQTEGIQAIVGKRHNHGRRYMTLEQERDFLKEFIQAAQAGQVIEARQIHLAYEKAVGHPVTRAAIYYMLHKHGWRKIMPRSKHPKKASEDEIQAYKKNQREDYFASYEQETAPGNVSGRGWIWTNQ